MDFTKQYAGSSNGLNINLSSNRPSYSQQFGGSNGTLSEQRQESKTGTDVAGIIGASAGGLDSITNFITAVTGKGGSSATPAYVPPPPPEKKTNPWLIGGIAAGVVVLIIVIILTKNGTSKQ